MSELRLGYNGTRILIEAERVLDASFAGQGIYLSGAQVEMLRNVTHYLNRRSTFVDEYHDGYYLMPDDTDWDLLQAITADMEDRLMALENVLWGYMDTYAEKAELRTGSAGTATLDGTPVPEGEVWVVEAMSLVNTTAARNRILLFVVSPGVALQVHTDATPEHNIYVDWQGRQTMKEGDYVRWRQWGCLANDELIGMVRGYKMSVPD